MYVARVDADALLAAVGPLAEGEALGVLVAAQSRDGVPRLVHELRAADVSFFGGVFPVLLDGAESHSEGLVAFRVPVAAPPMLVPDLDPERVTFPDHGACAPARADGRCTIVALVDGLSDRITPFLRDLYHHFGNEVTYLGGGAGSLDLRREPCVFTADGFAADAAVLAFVPRVGAIGVRHGWKPVLGPLVATRTRRNVIEELNWRPALAVYQGVFEAQTAGGDPLGSFFEVAQGHPFGIQRADAECIVRDPHSVDEQGGLVCFGDVPSNAVLQVLEGQPDDLVRAAGEAARDALNQSQLDGPRLGLVFDCISRAAFLKDRFEDEREAIVSTLRGDDAGIDVVGALSLGEIASYGEGILEFLNKTVVVGLIHDRSGCGEPT